MNIEIRKAKPEDAEAIIDIMIESWHNTYKDLVPNEIISKLQAKNQKRIEDKQKYIKENNNTYVAVVDNNIVGYCSYGKSTNNNYSTSCELYSIYILDNYHRLNLGRLLTIKTIEEAIEKGYTTMITECLDGNPNNKFHEAIGGIPYDRVNTTLMGITYEGNVYYHDDLKKSLDLNITKLKENNNFKK